MLALTGFHNWFKSSIHKWLQVVHEKSVDRIRKAVEIDKASEVKRKLSEIAHNDQICYNSFNLFSVRMNLSLSYIL